MFDVHTISPHTRKTLLYFYSVHHNVFKNNILYVYSSNCLSFCNFQYIDLFFTLLSCIYLLFVKLCSPRLFSLYIFASILIFMLVLPVSSPTLSSDHQTVRQKMSLLCYVAAALCTLLLLQKNTSFFGFGSFSILKKFV